MGRTKQKILSVFAVLVWLFASFNCGVCHASAEAQSSKVDHSCCDDNRSSKNSDHHEHNGNEEPCSNCISCISSTPIEQAKISLPQLSITDASFLVLAIVSTLSSFDFACSASYQPIATTAPPDQNRALQLIHSLVISPNAPPTI